MNFNQLIAIESNADVKEELINHLAKKTNITIENCTVDFLFGLNVKIALAKYEKVEAPAKAIVLDQNACDISLSKVNIIL